MTRIIPIRRQMHIKLSKLRGLVGTTVIFDPVDLSENEGKDIALEAGECYVLYVTREAKISEKNGYGKTYEFKTETEEDGKTTNVEYPTPVFQIDGVSVPAIREGNVTRNYTGLDFTGFYYRNEYVPADSYVISGGDMYHLTSNWNGALGTSWMLKDAQGRKLSFKFNDNGETTSIEGIFNDNGTFEPLDGNIYNLNSQKVGSSKNAFDKLQKGIYIMNGKKYVVNKKQHTVALTATDSHKQYTKRYRQSPGSLINFRDLFFPHIAKALICQTSYTNMKSDKLNTSLYYQ